MVYDLFTFFCKGKGYAVKDVVEGMEYEFRVSAINNSGAGEFSTPSEFVFARDPKSTSVLSITFVCMSVTIYRFTLIF